MYEVFDSFCKMPTWESSHPADRERFRRALEAAVNLPGFSPEAMGDYIRRNHTEPIWGISEADLSRKINGLIREAEAALASRY